MRAALFVTCLVDGAGSVRHQHVELARRFGDEAPAVAAEELAGRTFERSEFLVDRLGSTFAVKNAGVSAARRTDKISAIEATGAEGCSAGPRPHEHSQKRRWRTPKPFVA